MNHREAFGDAHPLVTFVFFAVAIVFGMLFRSPAFELVSVGCAAIYYGIVRRREALGGLLGMIPVFVGITLINPLFNTLGDTVLFTYFGDRPYTLEALAYGAAMGGMLVGMLLWFFSYNAVMSSDKFTYLFGSLAPTITLVLTMVLRFVPTYHAKIAQFATARASIGKALGEGGLRERATNGLAIVSILTTWAFENAIVTADSMRSRGYGVGKRAHFARFRFTARDGVLLAIIVGLSACVIVTASFGVTAAEFTPAIVLAPPTPLFWVGLGAYLLLLALPSALDGLEHLRWTILLSNI